MINELLSFQASLASWGQTIDCMPWHTKFQTISDKNSFIVVTLLGGSGFRLAETKLVLPEYVHCLGSQDRTLCKYDPRSSVEQSVETFAKCMSCWERFAQDAAASGVIEMGSVHALLSSPDFDFAAVLDDPLIQSKTKICYLVFDTEPPVQTMANYTRINQYLRGQSNHSETLDHFGKSDNGWPEKTCTAKAKYKLTWYSKNDDNDCFKRFGLNSSTACRVGNVVRQEISDLWQWLVTEDHRIHAKNQKGLWYEYSANDTRFIVLSSLFPKSLLELTEFDLKDFDRNAWRDAIQDLMKSLTAPQYGDKLDARLAGQVVVIRLPGNGPAVLEYSKAADSIEIGRCVDDWCNGCDNGILPTSGEPWNRHLSIRTALAFLNRRWKCISGKTDRVETPLYVFALDDVYELFFGSREVAARALNTLAHSAPMLLDARRAGISDAQYMRSLCFLVLHKLGIYKESFMDHWAYVLGEIYQLANSIHYKYFNRRGLDAPDSRIGYRYAQMSFQNPRRAFGEFRTRLQHYLGAAEDNFVWYARQLEVLDLQLVELLKRIGGTLPVTMSDTDKIMLSLGYSCGRPNKAVDEDIIPTQEGE